MMNDYISRKTAIDRFAKLRELASKRVDDTPNNSPCYMRYLAQYNERRNAVELLSKMPPADVRKNVRGKWVEPNNEVARQLNQWICDRCNCLINGKHNFCPNCGADMRGDNEDQK